MNRILELSIVSRLPVEMQHKLQIDRLEKRGKRLRRRQLALHERMIESFATEMALRQRGVALDLADQLKAREVRRHNRWNELHGLAAAVGEMAMALRMPTRDI